MSGLLLIRADAGPQVGTGHVWRGLALAQAWQDAGGSAALVARSLPAALAARLWAADVAVHRLDPDAGPVDDAHQTARLAARLGAAAVALDHYGLGVRWQHAARRVAAVLAWDDHLHQPRFDVDVLVHPQPLIHPAALADRAPGASVCVGPRFVPLRRDLRRDLRAPGPRRRGAGPAHLLVTFGGADPVGLTARAVRALQPLPFGVRATVLGGLANPAHADLGAALAGAPGWRVLQHTDRLADLLGTVDLVLGAGGTSTWERCALGVPQALVEIADNQARVVAAAEAAGAAVSLGAAAAVTDAALREAPLALLADPSRLRALGEAGRTLVDGRGGARVVAALQARVARRRLLA